MKEQLEKLIELQKIDLEQEALRVRVDERRDKVNADTENLQELAQMLDDHTKALENTKTILGTKREELERAERELEHSKEKLNAVTNSRDYAALEREGENFRKIITAVEADIESLQKELVTAEAKEKEMRTSYEALSVEIEAARREVDEASASIEDQVNELKAKADVIAKLIKPQILARYRFIRSKRAGAAVVSASGGTCTGCHMKLQPQAYIVLQRQNSLECCQNCQRIIYFDAEEAAELHNHPAK
ncbi:MAG: hypothetical protein IKY83_07285 [Proteobacteria bacterium]|nr:hypothetical protein [Pseudomonadota bacterium]